MNDISINRSDSKDKSSCVLLPGSKIVSTWEDYGWDKFCANAVSWKANAHGNRWWPWRSCSELTLHNYWFEAGDAFILKVITQQQARQRCPIRSCLSQNYGAHMAHTALLSCSQSRTGLNGIFMAITFQICWKPDSFIKDKKEHKNPVRVLRG